MVVIGGPKSFKNSVTIDFRGTEFGLAEREDGAEFAATWRRPPTLAAVVLGRASCVGVYSLNANYHWMDSVLRTRTPWLVPGYECRGFDPG